MAAGEAFRLMSRAFGDGKPIPSKYANRGVTGGQNVPVPLAWENPPAGTKSFTLACIDLHPIAGKWVHWLVINIPPNSVEIPEGAGMPRGCRELANTFGEQGWGGPQPPKGSGVHKYEFSLYALNVDTLDLAVNTSLAAFLKAIDGRVLGAARMIGVFER